MVNQVPNEGRDPEAVTSREPFTTPASHTKHYAVIAAAVIGIVAAVLYVGAHIH